MLAAVEEVCHRDVEGVGVQHRHCHTLHAGHSAHRGRDSRAGVDTFSTVSMPSTSVTLRARSRRPRSSRISFRWGWVGGGSSRRRAKVHHRHHPTAQVHHPDDRGGRPRHAHHAIGLYHHLSHRREREGVTGRVDEEDHVLHRAAVGGRAGAHDPSRNRRTTLCSSRLRLFSSWAAEVMRATAEV